ncbi:MAG: response regulator [Pseudomonadota bacterium]
MDILLIEDDELDAFHTKRMVAKVVENVTIVRARTGDEAIDLAMSRRKPFDFVLLDHFLVNECGVNLVRPLRGAWATEHCPIVMLTGAHLDAVRTSALVNELSAFLTKPISTQRVTEILVERKLYWRIEDFPLNLDNYRKAIADSDSFLGAATLKRQIQNEVP